MRVWSVNGLELRLQRRIERVTQKLWARLDPVGLRIARRSKPSFDFSATGTLVYVSGPPADRCAMERLSATSPAFDTPRLVASITLGLGGLLLAAMWMVLSIDRAFLIGLSLGLAAALAIQWYPQTHHMASRWCPSRMISRAPSAT